MSKNLIEKLQEIWNDLQQEPTVKQIKAAWKKFSSSDGFVATEKTIKKVAADTTNKIKQNPKFKKLWIKARRSLHRNKTALKIMTLTAAFLAPTSNMTVRGEKHIMDKDEEGKFRTELAISSTMRNLQSMHSEQQLDSICSKLIGEENTFKQICADRSAELGEEILRLAQEIQSEVKTSGRKILKQRWGRDVPLGQHCIRSALELTTEAAQNMGMPEILDGFVSKIQENNPNSYWGFYRAFSKHKNFKSSTNILMAINKDIKENPNDIFLISHDSPNAGSGHHTVLYVQGKIVSFNNESLGNADQYFQYVSKKGKFINLSKTIREDCKQEIVKEVVKQMMDNLKNGNTKQMEQMIAQYVNNKDIPLEDRMTLGTDFQLQATAISGNNQINLLDNFAHLRQVRAKLPQAQTASKEKEATDKTVARVAGRRGGKTRNV